YDQLNRSSPHIPISMPCQKGSSGCSWRPKAFSSQKPIGKLVNPHRLLRRGSDHKSKILLRVVPAGPFPYSAHAGKTDFSRPLIFANNCQFSSTGGEGRREVAVLDLISSTFCE